MSKRGFAKDFLLDVLGDDDLIISDVIVENSRWSILHELTFKHEDKFYQVCYSVGATEQQDESPWEYEKGEIECDEVIPVQKTITVYEAKP
jgi:hypothetical protein